MWTFTLGAKAAGRFRVQGSAILPILSNPKHERFSQELAMGKTATEAYESSGLERTSIFPKDGFYVYALVDPRSGRVFYIGKGCRNRYAIHAADRRRGKVVNAPKFAIIGEIHRSGLEVEAICLLTCQDERLAYRVERKLIGIVGFKALTNIQPGTKTEDEKASEEAKYMLRHMEPFSEWVRHRQTGVDESWYWRIVSNLREVIQAVAVIEANASI